MEMKLIDEKNYKKNLKELMETPFGRYHEKQTIKQPYPEPKLINEQPIEIQTTLASATPQPHNTRTNS